MTAQGGDGGSQGLEPGGARRIAVRTATLSYIVVLWLAVVVAIRPAVTAAPVVGPVFGAAAGLLRALTLAPGIPVFTDPGSEWSDWVTVAACFDVRGRRAGGDSLELYRPKCPPVGFQWRHDAFDELMQYTTRHLRLGRLLEETSAPAGSLPEPVRRFVAIGDYFCHSPLVAPPDLTAVSMRLTLHSQHYQTGRFSEQSLVCRWVCNEPGSYKPRCRMTPMVTRGYLRGS